jgi:hypothetical protein
MKLSTARALTGALAIVPGWEIGKAIMCHLRPGMHHITLELQVFGSLALGYGIAYFVIGCVAAQFVKSK